MPLTLIAVQKVLTGGLRAVAFVRLHGSRLARAVVADGSASGREPPRVVLIWTWGRVEVARTGFRPVGGAR